jgi:ParB family chromosome partitioning protein
VPVVVVELDALRSELATLDENIVRYELTELERAEMEARRREIYETLYPLAKYKVRRQSSDNHEFAPLKEGESDDSTSAETVSAPVSEPHSTLDVEVPPPYTRYAAEREGVTDRTVRNRLRIAEKLYPEVRDYIRGTPLADDQRGLLRLTRLEDPELQLLAARLIVEEGVPPRLAVERAQRGFSLQVRGSYCTTPRTRPTTLTASRGNVG